MAAGKANEAAGGGGRGVGAGKGVVERDMAAQRAVERLLQSLEYEAKRGTGGGGGGGGARERERRGETTLDGTSREIAEAEGFSRRLEGGWVTAGDDDGGVCREWTIGAAVCRCRLLESRSRFRV